MKAPIRAAAAALAALAVFSCAKMENIETRTPEVKGGEIRTLRFGLPQTKTSVSYDGTEKALKLQWTEGDNILVVSSTGKYLYKLVSAEGASGVGTFQAVDKGLPALDDNTGSIYIYHSGATVGDNPSMAYQTQKGNGNMDHLKGKVLLMKGDATAVPKKVEDLEGTMASVNSVMNFKVNYPASGLDADEYPTAFYVIADSWGTNFMSSVLLTSQGIQKTGSSSVRQSGGMKLELDGINAGDWNATTPLNLYLSVIMDDNAFYSGDKWRFMIVTNKYRTLYEDKTIKSKPLEGYYYPTLEVSPSVDPLSVSGDFAFSTSREEYESAIRVKLYANFTDGGLLMSGKTYQRSEYCEIQLLDKDGKQRWRSYVSGSGGKGDGGGKDDGSGKGKGGGFSGEGYVECILTPGETYSYRPVVVVDDYIEYFGPAKSFTVPPVTVCTDKEIDFGTDVLWAGWNVGATRPEEIGGYYAWGETEEQTASDPSDPEEVKKLYSLESYKFYSHYNYSFTIIKYKRDEVEELEAEDDVACVKWGDGWRMPTKSDVQKLFENVDGLQIYEYNGVKGALLVGRGAYKDKNLFLPSGGVKLDGGMEYADYAMLWTSTLYTSTNGYYNNLNAYVLQSNEPDTGTPLYRETWQQSNIFATRAFGRNVRPVKPKAASGTE